jgi:uncharacterized membrane protein
MKVASKIDNRNMSHERRIRLTNAGIAMAVSLTIALLIYGSHLLDSMVPIEGDVRAHIFKIDILHSYLMQGSWPQWIPYWYHGFPMGQYYPPGFYFLGASLIFIFKHAIISYKLLLLFTLMFNGLAIYYFSRRFLKFNLLPSILCLIAYESSTPLLVNYLNGVGPNLLGWSISVCFLTIYLSNVADGRTRGLVNIMLPAFVLGVAILIHPFPVIFVGLAVIVFHIIWLLYNRSFRTSARYHLPYLVAVFGIAALISIHYWLPAFLTLNYASPIYVFTKDIWPGGIPYLFALTVLALAVALIIHSRIKGDIRLSLLIACLLLASALGFGATRYFPFGLGSLVHEFRFATIMAPFFGILLIAFLLTYKPVHLKRDKLVAAFITSFYLVSIVFIVAKLDFIIRFFDLASTAGYEISYHVLVGLVFHDFPKFAITMLPFFVILLVAFSLDFSLSETKKNKLFIALPVGICLILLVCVFPLIFTWREANLSRLFSYVKNYQQPEYTELLQSVKNGRLIVPIDRGALCEGDSPVTFGWYWGVETVNGPYNQGDPKFFKHTVHLEWEEKWFDYEYSRENLMQESGAKYIFIRHSRSSPANTNGLTPSADNDYGKLLELNEEVNRAVKVTPVLLDVKNPTEVTEFFNILLPEGYRMVFVNVHEADENSKEEFAYVMLDNESKLLDYKGKVVFILDDTDRNNEIGITEQQGVIRLRLPYITYTNKFFYRGDEGNFKGWRSFDSALSSRMDANEYVTIENVGREISRYLERLNYEPASYKRGKNSIELITEPGFTLIKDSYFPYWETKQGKVLPTSQGFMLIYSHDTTVVLNYKKPTVNIIATIISIASLVTVAVALAISILTKLYRVKSTRPVPHVNQSW